jgi:hypothetical protein
MKSICSNQRDLFQRTMYHCWRLAVRFLQFPFNGNSRDLSTITCDDIARFMQHLTSGRKPFRYKTPPTHLRNFFRSYHCGLDMNRSRQLKVYMHADMRLKERALERVTPTDSRSGRYRPGDALLEFLRSPLILPHCRDDPLDFTRVRFASDHNVLNDPSRIMLKLALQRDRSDDGSIALFLNADR